mgnify:CR=1 FL=1
MPAFSATTCYGDGPVHLINDEVISSSKWCTTSVPSYAVIDLGENKEISRWIVYHANARGAGEGVDMNTVAFDFQYAPDDGEPLLTGDDSASRSRVRITCTQHSVMTSSETSPRSQAATACG